MPFIPKTIVFTDVINPLNEQIVAFPQTVDGREGWTVGYRTNYSKEMLEMGYEDGYFSLVFYAGIDSWKAAKLAKEMDGQDDWKNDPSFRSNCEKAPITAELVSYTADGLERTGRWIGRTTPREAVEISPKFLESLTDSEIEQGFV